MNINQALDVLSRLLKNNDWFYEAEIDKDKNLVAYVHWMDGKILREVPDNVEEHRVLVHFSVNKTATREQYTSDDKAAPMPLVNPSVVDVTHEAEYLGNDETEELPSSYLESDLSDLTKELDRLERICGSNILQDIFYEVHDGPNHVTNLSVKFPEVKKAVEKIYDEYGFDIIYEELDG